MSEEYHCLYCEQDENNCRCERYCTLCQSTNDVRLCQDGLYYCLECREVCDFRAQ